MTTCRVSEEQSGSGSETKNVGSKQPSRCTLHQVAYIIHAITAESPRNSQREDRHGSSLGGGPRRVQSGVDPGKERGQYEVEQVSRKK